MYEASPRPGPATLVPREQLVNPQRWQTTEFAPAGAVPAPAPSQPAAELVEDVARLAARLDEERQQARAAGHAEGLRSGRETGLREGQTQGREEGYAAGYAQGLEEGREASYAEAAALTAVLQGCTRAATALYDAVGPSLLQLAQDIARQVVRSELKLQPELIAAVVRELLEADATTRSAATVYLHPDDVALATAYAGEALAESGWRVTADPTLTRGGCRVQSAYGDIDATLQTRWREICAAAGGDTPWQD